MTVTTKVLNMTQINNTNLRNRIDKIKNQERFHLSLSALCSEAFPEESKDRIANIIRGITVNEKITEYLERQIPHLKKIEKEARKTAKL